jgi:hypothetical protein
MPEGKKSEYALKSAITAYGALSTIWTVRRIVFED